MADDEIEKLLREINASTQGASGAVDKPQSRSLAKPEAAGGGRLAFAVVAGVGLGATTFVFAVLTPFTDAFQMGTAGAFAGFVTALVAGPPRWFSS